MKRRIETRLAALERGQSTGGMTRSEQTLLVAILARRDAMFWPWRFQLGNSTPLAEIRRRQNEYLAGAVGVAVKADGRGEWKNAHEMRQRLIATGMIAATHSGGQVTSVFLTALGEATARALVGDRLCTATGVEPVFHYLRILAEESGCDAVRESTLLNVPSHGNPEDWNHRTELMLPLLSCGSVDAQPDTQGRILYCPRDVPLPPSIAVDVEPHEDFDDCYIAAYNGERQVLASVEPRDQHEIFVPIPASVLWPDTSPQDENHEQK